MTKFSLLRFFLEVIQIAINMEPNKYGSPVSYLLENIVLYQEDFLNRILEDRGYSTEVRINGSGLKMYFRHRGPRGKVTIGGDQIDLYPEFVKRVNELIREHQLTGITWTERRA